MASATSGKARPRAVNRCPYCGTTIPSPWQGRKTVTVCVVMLLLVVGFAGGRLLTPRDVQKERRRLQQDQTRLHQEQQQLEGTRQQLVAERQRLTEERQQLTTAKAPEQQPVPPRRETQVAVGVPPATPLIGPQVAVGVSPPSPVVTQPPETAAPNEAKPGMAASIEGQYRLISQVGTLDTPDHKWVKGKLVITLLSQAIDLQLMSQKFQKADARIL